MYEDGDIRAALEKLKAAGYSPLMAVADVDTAMQYIQHQRHNYNTYQVGDFYMVLCPAQVWYMREPVLIEELVIRLGHRFGNSVEEVPAVMKQVAQAKGIKYIITGDAQRGLMAPVYLGAGFKKLGEQYYGISQG